MTRYKLFEPLVSLQKAAANSEVNNGGAKDQRRSGAGYRKLAAKYQPVSASGIISKRSKSEQKPAPASKLAEKFVGGKRVAIEDKKQE